jgi:hypothetical protein
LGRKTFLGTRRDGKNATTWAICCGAGHLAGVVGWRWCELPVTLNPTNRFALIVMCEAISARIESFARMLSSALRCAGAVTLAGFRSGLGGDRSEGHC